MDPQFLNDISASVDKWQKFAPIFASIAAITYALYICTVTESIAIIKNRIAELIGTKHTFNHEKLKKHQQQELDLDHFNFKFMLNVKTPYAMDKLITWAEHSGIRLNEIKKARPYLNLTEQTFTIPKPRFRKAIATLVFTFSASIFLLLYLPNAALLKVNRTGQWFWVTQKHAYSFTSYLPAPLHVSDSWTMTSGNCLLDSTPAPLSDSWDKKVICYLLLDNKKGYVEKTINEQKIVAGFLSAPWLLIPFSIWQGSRRRKRAAELQRRAQRKLRLGDSPLPEYARYYHD